MTTTTLTSPYHIILITVITIICVSVDYFPKDLCFILLLHIYSQDQPNRFNLLVLL